MGAPRTDLEKLRDAIRAAVRTADYAARWGNRAYDRVKKAKPAEDAILNVGEEAKAVLLAQLTKAELNDGWERVQILEQLGRLLNVNAKEKRRG